MSALLDEQARLTKRIRLLRKEEKKLVQAGRCLEPDTPKAGRCPASWLTAQLVFHLSDGSRDAAEAFWACVRRNRADSLVLELRQRITTWEALPADAVSCFLDKHGREGRHLERASRFLTQFRLKAWVLEQNAKKAVAPTGRCLSEQSMVPDPKHKCRSHGGEGLAMTSGRERRERQWLRRWARRFAMRRGGFPVGPSMEATEMQEKAAENRTGGQQKVEPPVTFVVPLLGPESGPRIGPTGMKHESGPSPWPAGWARSGASFFWEKPLFFTAKATAAWSWVNFLVASCPPGRRVVHLNLDETSLPLVMPQQKGFRASDKELLKAGHVPKRLPAPLGHRRAVLSYLAIIADSDAVQALLPQIILMNKRTLPQRDFQTLVAEGTGSQVQIWRRDTAWATGATLASWVAELSKALGPLLSEYWFILHVDCCPTHLSLPFLRACGRAGINVHLLPGGMTHVLQPLDTHVFARLKGTFRHRQMQARLDSPSCALTPVEMVRCWLQCIRETMTHRGSPAAFSSTGLLGAQAHVGQRCMRELRLPPEWKPPVPDLPSLRQLHVIVGSMRHLHLGWLFSTVVQSSRNSLRADAAEEADVIEARPTVRSHPMRLRSASSFSVTQPPAPPKCPERKSSASVPGAPRRPMAKRLWGLPKLR